MSQARRTEGYQRLSETAADWVGRSAHIFIGSHAASSTIMRVDGVIDHARELPEEEAQHPGGALELKLRGDNEVVLTLHEETLLDLRGCDSTWLLADLAGVEIEMDVDPA